MHVKNWGVAGVAQQCADSLGFISNNKPRKDIYISPPQAPFGAFWAPRNPRIPQSCFRKMESLKQAVGWRLCTGLGNLGYHLADLLNFISY